MCTCETKFILIEKVTCFDTACHDEALQTIGIIGWSGSWNRHIARLEPLIALGIKLQARFRIVAHC
jgi:hypothetical protein